MTNSRPLPLLVLLTLATGTIAADVVEAQMFGARQVGRPLARRAAPTGGPAIENEGVGTLRNQRFIRGNRNARNFVGSDRTDAQFVGAQQAGTGAMVRSAVAGVNAGSGDLQVNQPVTRASNARPYDPRLVLGFPYDGPPQDALVASLTRRLHRQLGPQIAVSLVDRTATLRGEVASVEERQLAEILVSFEPGISAVQNGLQVVGGTEAARLPPPPPPRP